MIRLACLTCLSIALMACDSRQPADSDRKAAPESEQEVAATAPTMPEDSHSSEPAGSDGPSPSGNGDGFSSTYAKFDIDACTITEQELEEGSYTEWKCPANRGVAIFAQDGDGRMDMDFGAEDDAFQTYGGFNNLGDTIEWRMKDGEPFAGIFRYSDATEQGKGRTILAVETIGTVSRSGCRLAQITGDTVNANNRAREIADAAFGRTGCGETRYIGDYAR